MGAFLFHMQGIANCKDLLYIYSREWFLKYQDVHPKKVQELLGHSTIVLTLDTYSHIIPSMHSETADKMDSVFG